MLDTFITIIDEIERSDITLADPGKRVHRADKIYNMVKVNEVWKIASIQN